MATTDSVRGQLAQRAGNGGGDVAQHGNGAPTLGQLIEQMKPELQRALPAHMDANRMARIALTLVRRTRNLDRCTPQSFLGALMTCAQLGLEPGVGGEAWILPYWNSRRQVHEAQLIVGYAGMVKLFWQSSLAKSLDAQAVYRNDEFDFAYGLEPRLVHRPNLSGDRGEPYAYYAVATTTSGGSAFVVMSKADIERIRDRSGAKDDGPWATDYDAMAKKTCLRQLFKLLPKSTAIEHALMHDGTIRTERAAEGIDIEPRYIQGDEAPAGVNTVTGELENPPEGAEAGEDDGGPGEAEQPRCDVRGCVEPDTHDRSGHQAWAKARRGRQQDQGGADDGEPGWPDVVQPGTAGHEDAR